MEKTDAAIFEKLEINKLYRDFYDASWLSRQYKNVKIAIFGRKLLILISKMSRFDNSSNFLILNTNLILSTKIALNFH